MYWTTIIEEQNATIKELDKIIAERNIQLAKVEDLKLPHSYGYGWDFDQLIKLG